MTILILHATRNSPPSARFPQGRKDATGAFIPKAYRMRDYYARVAPIIVRGFDNHAPPAQRMRTVERHIESVGTRQVTLLAILCHGWRNRLDTGHSLATVKRLARSIRAVCVDDVRIALMACSTAATRSTPASRKLAAAIRRKIPEGEGGFADALRDELVVMGCAGGWIDGHTTAGPATENPFVRRMAMERVEGGKWIVEPRSALWERWRTALHDDLQYRFPVLELDAIRALLEVTS